MKRAFIIAALALSTPVILRAQQPMPDLSITANDTQELNLYSGWPLIVHETIMNSSRFPNNGTPTELLISPTGAPWTSAIQFTAIDASGQAHVWPLNLIGTPGDAALTLAPTSYVRFTVQMAPTDVSSLAPGTYQLTATLQVSNSNGWNGVVQSRPVTIQFGPEPSPLSPEQQSRKALLIAEYQTNAGDLNGALSTVEKLMQSQPSNALAMSAAANLLELLGYPGLAFFQAREAINAYFQANPSLYDPPSSLLAMNQRLFTTVKTPSSGQTLTTTTASGAQVTFSPSSQNVSLSASVSTNTGAPVDGGTVTFTVIGLGGSLVSSLNHGNASALFTAPAGTPAGIYVLEAAFSGTGGFAASSDSSRALTINKATPAISWSVPADLTYGGVLGPAQLNATASVSGIFSYNPPAGTLLAVGSGQSLSTAFTPSDALDYNSANASVSINVRPEQLTVTANSAARQYGALDPPFTASFSGFVNGDTASVLSGTLSCASNATARSPVGTYAINCSGLTSPNYAINHAPGALVITPAPLTVTANNVSRQYGGANPPFTVSFSGFVNGDTASALSGALSCSSNATMTSPVGTYNITCSGLTSPDYTITFQGGTLTVIPAVVTITANNTTKILDAPNPNFSWTASGFVNGENTSVLTANLACTTAATSTSPVGSYSITCSGASAANYTFSYVPGTLRILYATSIGHVIQPPISADGTSIFNQGRTIPAKFSVYDANGVSIGTPGVISSFYLTGIQSGTTTSTTQDIVYTNNPDTSFRWDSMNQQWVFNISTTNLTAGNTYMYTITLNDGSIIMFQYGLR